MTSYDDDLAQLRANCEPACPGPTPLEAARGGHNCADAIRRQHFGEHPLERARRTAVELEQQLARIGELIDVHPANELIDQLRAVLDGDELETRRALAELAQLTPDGGD